MPRIVLLLTLVVLSPLCVRRGECSFSTDRENPVNDQCPQLYVECPDDVFNEKSPLKFQARVSGTTPGQRLTYHWTVSWVRGFPKGRIKSGQGTSSIIVEASGPARKGLTVTVSVKGFPKGCGKQASCTIGIASLHTFQMHAHLSNLWMVHASARDQSHQLLAGGWFIVAYKLKAREINPTNF
jgi:hypothetical protein